MENNLISVVVPVYNVEKYLSKCIESILNQDYSNFELILVNDGSTDESGKICEHYKDIDSRIKVINKKNGGLSDARNYGIDIATGKYITFIDSDDFIEPDYISYLYNLTNKYNTKISICAHTVLLENGKKIDGGKNYKETIMNKEDAIKRMLNEEGFSVSAWAKLYSLDLFSDIRYPLGKLCEDNGTTYKLFDKVEQVTYGNNPKYYYLKRNGSIMLSKFDIRKMDMIELTDEMCDYLEKKYSSLESNILRRRIYARFNILRQLDESKEALAVEDDIINYILKYKKIILLNKAFNKRDKIATVLLMSGKKNFKRAWKIYSKAIYKT